MLEKLETNNINSNPLIITKKKVRKPSNLSLESGKK
jgi:hypothetical protein